MISEKYFLSGCIHLNSIIHIKFHVSSCSSFGSALMSAIPILPPHGMISENSFLSGYIYHNRNIVWALRRYVNLSVPPFIGLCSILYTGAKGMDFWIFDLVKNPDRIDI